MWSTPSPLAYRTKGADLRLVDVRGRLEAPLITRRKGTFMSFAVGVIIFVVAIILTLIMHELAHAVVAERLGQHCQRFFVGMGPTLWKHDLKRGTEIGVKLFPIGAFVALDGMDGQLEDGDSSDAPPAKPWKVTLIALAGPVSHFVLAIILLCTVFGTIPVQTATNEVASVNSGSPASTAGIRPGDHVVAVDGTPESNWSDAYAAVRDAGGTASVTVRQGDRRRSVDVDLSGSDMLGVKLQTEERNRSASSIVVDSVTAFGVISAGTMNSYLHLPELIVDRFSSSGDEDGAQMMSLIGAAQVTGEAADSARPVFMLVLVIVSLNISLGVLNLIPLLPMDGGQVVLAGIQAVRDRRARKRGLSRAPTSDKIQRIAMSGTVVVFGGLVLAMGALVVADIFVPLQVDF